MEDLVHNFPLPIDFKKRDVDCFAGSDFLLYLHGDSPAGLGN